MTIQILADSACDLPKQDIQSLHIKILPLTLHLDDKDYRDGEDIQPEALYDAMRNGKNAKTSQVSPLLFKDIFTQYAEQNKPLIYLAFSSRLSGTFQTAQMIVQEVKEQYPNAPLYVIDTKCASLGYGLVVIQAAELAQKGASIEDIIDIATYRSEHMEHIFSVDDLEYLYRGGRVTKTAAFIGSLLKIKPILHVEDGKLIPLEKIRGERKMLSRIVEILIEKGRNLELQTIGISHGDDIEKAEKLATMIRENCTIKDIKITTVGSVIGAHAGPGTIALFFLNEFDK